MIQQQENEIQDLRKQLSEAIENQQSLKSILFEENNIRVGDNVKLQMVIANFE